MSNVYEDAGEVEGRVLAGDHRGVIGGRWEEVGAWQFSFCKAQGLKPENSFLDVGCGSLRGGVHFVRYLEPNRYAGVDVHASLLDAGYERELVPAGLAEKLGRDRLRVTTRFEVSAFADRFDMALAQSVFTHLPLNHLRLCLSNLAGVMKPGGRFYVTYFEIGEDEPLDAVVERGEGITTRFEANPFHYRFSDLERAADGLPVAVRRLGDQGHPRGQFVAEFLFLETRNETRGLSAEGALALPAGADHYRAYVGPPQRFDFMSSTQFALLNALGLREEDRVLDVGCGSLRLGRLLIPFLLPERYYGVDPNTWLIEEGLRHELGREVLRLKRPAFSDTAAFDFSSFGQAFDFVIAQSVATHTGPDLLARLIKGAAASLTPGGLFLFSYIRADEDPVPADGWYYPDCVGYSQDDIISRLNQAGLAACAIPWFHPAASWIAASRDAGALPTAADMPALEGRVVARRTDTKGYAPKR